MCSSIFTTRITINSLLYTYCMPVGLCVCLCFMLRRLMELKASGLHSCVGVKPAALCQPVRKLRHASSCVCVSPSVCVCAYSSECIFVCKHSTVCECWCVCVFDMGTAWSTASSSAWAKFPLDVTPAGHGQEQDTLGTALTDGGN